MRYLALALACLIVTFFGAAIYFAYQPVSPDASPLWRDVGGALGFIGAVLLGLTGIGWRRRR